MSGSGGGSAPRLATSAQLTLASYSSSMALNGPRAFQSLDERLRFCIAHRHLIEVVYHGSRRVVEPHDYGVYKGIERLLVFQLRESAPSHHGVTGWRLLSTAEIEECLVLVKSFPGSRGRARQSHLRWDTLYARVS